MRVALTIAAWVTAVAIVAGTQFAPTRLIGAVVCIGLPIGVVVQAWLDGRADRDFADTDE